MILFSNTLKNLHRIGNNCVIAIYKLITTLNKKLYAKHTSRVAKQRNSQETLPKISQVRVITA